jgi:gliding motility-associated-like protein
LCKGGTLKLVATNPRSVYQWNTGSKDSFIYTFNSGKYKVTVSNPCGVASDSINISVQGDYCDLFMVNAFTPGNDLLNNVFMPRGRNITVKLFQIYNRWGELVFETDQNNVGWDGTYSNKNADMGLYIWKLFYTVPNGPFVKKSNASGQILLIR